MPLIEHSERVRRALEYLCDECREHPETAREILIDQTCLRFDLSPLDARQLAALFSQTEQER